jgi:hypothetical protein
MSLIALQSEGSGLAASPTATRDFDSCLGVPVVAIVCVVTFILAALMGVF